jgi:hypothetical protein
VPGAAAAAALPPTEQHSSFLRGVLSSMAGWLSSTTIDEDDGDADSSADDDRADSPDSRYEHDDGDDADVRN